MRRWQVFAVGVVVGAGVLVGAAAVMLAAAETERLRTSR